MKFLVVFALLVVIQTIAAQQMKVHNQVNKPGHQTQMNVTSQHQQQNALAHNSQVQHHVQNVAQHVVHHVAQHVSNEVHKLTNPHPMQHNKIGLQVPNTQENVAIQVSQNKPTVVKQHVANPEKENKQRMVLSLMNKLNANVAEKPRKCVYECSPLDLTVCAYNGRCYQEFESQCEMSAYNCLNTQKKFHLVHDAECQDTSAVKCYPGDM